MMMVMLMLKLFHCGLESILVHCLTDLSTVELCPGGSYKACLCVDALEQFNRSHDLVSGRGIGTAHDDEVGICNLIIEELAEVAHIHAALACVNNSYLCADQCTFNAGDCGSDIGELAYTRRLNDDAVGSIVLHDLLQSLGEVADQSAADAAGIHLGDLNTRVLQEAAVYCDLAEFIFNKNELLALVALGDELADKCGFSGAEEAGEYVYSCHGTFYLHE